MTILRDILLATGIVWWILVATVGVWLLVALRRAPIDPPWADNEPTHRGGA